VFASVLRKPPWPELAKITEKHPKLGQAEKRAPRHLGTLGTGNHFIEICLDEEQRVWVMLHSGSRGIGNRIGSYFIELAKQDMRKWFINLPDEDLAYFPQGTDHFNDYFKAVSWAQRFARLNRDVMMQATLTALGAAIPKLFETDLEAVNCHHNYVSQEKHFGADVLLTRKGAVSATQKPIEARRAKTTQIGLVHESGGRVSDLPRSRHKPRGSSHDQ
jgi:tRNA-splicing ligase RtcB